MKHDTLGDCGDHTEIWGSERSRTDAALEVQHQMQDLRMERYVSAVVGRRIRAGLAGGVPWAIITRGACSRIDDADIRAPRRAAPGMRPSQHLVAARQCCRRLTLMLYVAYSRYDGRRSAQD